MYNTMLLLLTLYPSTQASKLHCQKRELEEAVKALLANLNKQVVLVTNPFLLLEYQMVWQMG